MNHLFILWLNIYGWLNLRSTWQSFFLPKMLWGNNIQGIYTMNTTVGNIYSQWAYLYTSCLIDYSFIVTEKVYNNIKLDYKNHITWNIKRSLLKSKDWKVVYVTMCVNILSLPFKSKITCLSIHRWFDWLFLYSNWKRIKQHNIRLQKLYYLKYQMVIIEIQRLKSCACYNVRQYTILTIQI